MNNQTKKQLKASVERIAFLVKELEENGFTRNEAICILANAVLTSGGLKRLIDRQA